MVEEQFIIVHEGCGGTNGKRIWSFKEFNIHRDRVHKLPGVEGQRRGRAPSGHATREHPPPEKAQQYYEKRNTDKDRMKQRRRRKWQRLCLEAFLEEGKRNVEELSEERRKKLQKDYQAYLAADQRKAEQNEAERTLITKIIVMMGGNWVWMASSGGICQFGNILRNWSTHWDSLGFQGRYGSIRNMVGNDNWSWASDTGSYYNCFTYQLEQRDAAYRVKYSENDERPIETYGPSS